MVVIAKTTSFSSSPCPIVVGRLVDSISIVAEIGVGRTAAAAEDLPKGPAKVLRPAGVDDRIHAAVDPAWSKQNERDLEIEQKSSFFILLLFLYLPSQVTTE